MRHRLGRDGRDLTLVPADPNPKPGHVRGQQLGREEY